MALARIGSPTASAECLLALFDKQPWLLPMPEDSRLFAPATERNREPILNLLRQILPEQGLVLEIASGTGQHLAYWAPYFPQLVFQPSDVEPLHLESIAGWCVHGTNIRPPVSLDVAAELWPIERADAVLCINMIHIAPWEACLGLMAGVGRVLSLGGLLYLYGPFKREGQHTAPSNEAFDLSLRTQNPLWGVRDLEKVEEIARIHGLTLEQQIPMPANNFSVVFRR